MRFGVREICDVVFKPLTSVDIAGQHFDAMQPVLYLDTAKTSTLEGTATTVYAQGGKGNPRLIGWDGEKVITFTVEDALMSPISFAMLSGAGVVKGNKKDGKKIYVHTTYDLVVEKDNQGTLFARLTAAERNDATLVVSKEAPVYPVVLDSAGAQKTFLSAITDQQIYIGAIAGTDSNYSNNEQTQKGKDILFVLASKKVETDNGGNIIPGFESSDYSPEDVQVGDSVRIDCYTVHDDGAYEMEIEAGTFAGYYYIEASTLFRDEATGVDMPAEFIIPRGKIQSNFTFSMAASGDPSTFTFTIDAFPAYTKFNKQKKVMAVLQIIEPRSESHNYTNDTVTGHADRTSDKEADDWYSVSVFDKPVSGSASGAEGNQ